MINIENYLDDGANWQAQAVLAYLRHERTFIGEKYNGHIDVQAGRFENGREQGYAIRVLYNHRNVMTYTLFEHRNSDSIVIFKSSEWTINTPTIDEVYGERGKYDYDKCFNYGQILECGKWIVDDMNKEIDNFIEKYQ